MRSALYRYPRLSSLQRENHGWSRPLTFPSQRHKCLGNFKQNFKLVLGKGKLEINREVGRMGAKLQGCQMMTAERCTKEIHRKCSKKRGCPWTEALEEGVPWSPWPFPSLLLGSCERWGKEDTDHIRGLLIHLLPDSYLPFNSYIWRSVLSESLKQPVWKATPGTAPVSALRLF